MSRRHPPSTPADPPLIDMLVQSLAASELVLALFDPGDQLQWANCRYHDEFLRGLALPVHFADVLRHGFHGGFGVKIDCGDVEQFLADILPRRRRSQFRKFATDTVDGRWWWMTETLLPNGWLLSSASDITDLKQHERVLRAAHDQALEASRHDPVTGALTREQVYALLQDAVARVDDNCAGPARAFSVVSLDLDAFKVLSERLAPAEADQLLASFTRHCQARLRPVDRLGRTSSDSFLLLLPDIRTSLACRIVDRVRAGAPLCAGALLTFSAGVAEITPGDTVQSLTRRLHERLVAARARGGNRTVGES